MKTETGAARLFSEVDQGQPFHGWLPLGADLHQGLANPKGWAALHIVVQKLIETDSEIERKDLYDQILIVENPGAVVVARHGDRVGMVQSFRFTGERLLTADPGYVSALANDGRFEELLTTLGRWQWELPKGLNPRDESTDLERLILNTAKLEAEQEAGYTIENARIAGRINANPTFFAHAQYAVVADIRTVGENNPEELEMIGKVKLFTASEIRKLTSEGEFEDGLSLAALAIAGFNF